MLERRFAALFKLPKWGGIMSDLFWLSEAQLDRLQPFFPKSRGKPRVDDRRLLSGIIFIQRNGLMWKHALAAYGPPKTLYNRWKRWIRTAFEGHQVRPLDVSSQIPPHPLPSSGLLVNRARGSSRRREADQENLRDARAPWLSPDPCSAGQPKAARSTAP